jgi:ketosteroid isomerase-like protein
VGKGIRPQRDTLDRLLVRTPAIGGALGAAFVRTPRRWSIRRQLLGLIVERGFAAMARSDIDLVLTYYEPDAEVWMEGMEGVGISECYRGHDGVRALYADIDEAWSDWRWTVDGVADGGNRFAVKGDFVSYGRGSGAETALKGGATVIELSRRGRVARQNWFVAEGGAAKALDALGLSEWNSGQPSRATSP